MKPLARILIILLAFTIVMGTIYVTVTSSSSTSVTDTQQVERGERPEFAGAGGERPEMAGAGWIFGAVRNIGVVSIIVALIVVPKGWLQRRQRQPQINSI